MTFPSELSQDSSYSTAPGCHGDGFHQESEDRILRDVLSRPWSILQYLEYLDSSCLLLLCPRVSNLIILWTISKLSLIQHSSGPSLMLSNPCDKDRIVRKQGHHHELPNISWENVYSWLFFWTWGKKESLHRQSQHCQRYLFCVKLHLCGALYSVFIFDKDW